MTDKHHKVPILIIVSGLPGSGKSTLSQYIAEHFMLPLIQKDMIKETLYDVLGCTTLSQSQLYGHASMVLLYQFAEVLLKKGQSCIVESAFHPILSTQDLLRLQQQYSLIMFQIYCYAPRAILAERVKQRWEEGGRHRGHMDHLRKLDPNLPISQDYLQPLPINGHTIQVDTTDFRAIDYEYLVAQIRDILGK